MATKTERPITRAIPPASLLEITSYALCEKSKTAITTETANLILLKSMVKLAKLDRVLLVRNETLERFTT